MSLDELLTSLERRRAETPDTPCNPAEVSAKPAQTGACTPDTPGTPQKIDVEVEVKKADGAALGTVSYWWRFQYAYRPPQEMCYCPPVTHAEALAGEPDAITAQPFESIPRRPDTPLYGEDVAVIQSWLAHINETDDEMIAAVIDQCRTDADARAWFISVAQKVITRRQPVE